MTDHGQQKTQRLPTQRLPYDPDAGIPNPFQEIPLKRYRDAIRTGRRIDVSTAFEHTAAHAPGGRIRVVKGITKNRQPARAAECGPAPVRAARGRAAWLVTGLALVAGCLLALAMKDRLRAEPAPAAAVAVQPAPPPVTAQEPVPAPVEPAVASLETVVPPPALPPASDNAVAADPFTAHPAPEPPATQAAEPQTDRLSEFHALRTQFQQSMQMIEEVGQARLHAIFNGYAALFAAQEKLVGERANPDELAAFERERKDWLRSADNRIAYFMSTKRFGRPYLPADLVDGVKACKAEIFACQRKKAEKLQAVRGAYFRALGQLHKRYVAMDCVEGMVAIEQEVQMLRGGGPATDGAASSI
ncbi:MAG: hypothetical protein JXR37_20925 [Kiritimatiellae bacterium]|nr:hypothetical protein [Kiritimatiellia bacterium]